VYISGSLWWKADQKIPRKRPLKLFGRTFFSHRLVQIRLLRQTSFFDEESPSEAPAWYCPDCKKVFAWFDAPGVPPEVCGGEPGRRGSPFDVTP
jgi:hypothetical protein